MTKVMASEFLHLKIRVNQIAVSNSFFLLYSTLNHIIIVYIFVFSIFFIPRYFSSRPRSGFQIGYEAGDVIPMHVAIGVWKVEDRSAGEVQL